MKLLRLHVASLAVVALCIAGLLSYSAPALAQAVTQWSQFLGNPSHSSYAADPAISVGNASQLGVKWMANLYSSDLGSPVVGYNSTLNRYVVYVGDERGDVYAVDAATGQELWSTNVGYGAAIRATPAVGPDGSVWIGTDYSGTLYKLNGATGEVLCTLKSPNSKPVMGSPMIVTPAGGSTMVYWDALDNGVLGPVVGTTESSCGQVWTTNVTSGAWTTPVYGVSASGEPLVLTGSADPASTETAFDAITGKVVWSYVVYSPGAPTSGWDIGAAATVSPPGANGFADGVVFATSQFGYQTAIDLTTGKPLWVYQTYPASFGGKHYVISSVALDGNQLVYGYFNGLISLNATTGAKIWTWTAPAGVDSSPAIIGPSGGEVVAFADLSGMFRVFSLSGGSQLYGYQTGSYISASPAEYNGTIYISSGDGFLYAFAPGGGNGAKPAETIASPSNGSQVANPDGSLTISGSATDGSSVKAVEIAIQSGGATGPWYNAATNTWGLAPFRNEATLTSPGASSTTWSYSVPLPASGGAYEVFANTVNGSSIVDKGSVAYFTVAPSMNEPTVHVSTTDTPPGSTFSATGNAFKPGETVTFTLLGNVVATATVGTKGNVPKTPIQMPTTAQFGSTALTLTGNTSGKSASAIVFVTNEWTQFGYSALRTAQEPNDEVIAHTIFAGASILNPYWIYSSGAAINTSPAVVNGIAYFGNDSGTLSAVRTATGSPAWTYTIPSGTPIRSSPAVDSTGQVIFGANDGNLYVLNNAGQLAKTVALGGSLGSPAYANGNIVVASNSGAVYSLSDPAWTTNWSANAGSPVTSPPAYDAKAGVVIVGTSNGNVIAYNSGTGVVRWTATTGGAINGLAISAGAGHLYAGSADGYVYTYAENTGSLLWKLAGDGHPVTAVDTNGNGPAFGTAGGTMYDVTATGSIYFQRSYGVNAIAGLAGAGSDEFGSVVNGNLELLRTNDGGWHFATGSTFGPGVAPVILDAMIFAGLQNGDFYAFTPLGYTPPPQTTVQVGSVLVRVNGSCSPIQ